MIDHGRERETLGLFFGMTESPSHCAGGQRESRRGGALPRRVLPSQILRVPLR